MTREDLEVRHNGLGPWEEIVRHHRDLTGPPTGTQTLINCHDMATQRFPAAIELRGLGAISDALIGQCS